MKITILVGIIAITILYVFPTQIAHAGLQEDLEKIKRDLEEKARQAQQELERGAQQRLEEERRKAEEASRQAQREIQQRLEEERRKAEEASRQAQMDLERKAQQQAEELKRGLETGVQDTQRKFQYDYQEAVNRFQNNYQYQQPNAGLDRSALDVIFQHNVGEYAQILNQNDALRRYETEQNRLRMQQQVEQFKAQQTVIWRDYDENAWNVISEQADRDLINIFSDPSESDSLYQSRDIVTEGSILLLKIMPVYDGREQKVTTFDKASRTLVKELLPGLKGSDIERDPTRTLILATIKTDYLLTGNFIQASDGNWISLEEAAMLGYKNSEVREAKLALKSLKLIVNSGDLSKAEDFENNLRTFVETIDEINREKESLKAYEVRKNYPVFAPVIAPIYNAIDKPSQIESTGISLSQKLEEERKKYSSLDEIVTQYGKTSVHLELVVCPTVRHNYSCGTQFLEDGIGAVMIKGRLTDDGFNGIANNVIYLKWIDDSSYIETDDEGKFYYTTEIDLRKSGHTNFSATFAGNDVYGSYTAVSTEITMIQDESDVKSDSEQPDITNKTIKIIPPNTLIHANNTGIKGNYVTNSVIILDEGDSHVVKIQDPEWPVTDLFISRGQENSDAWIYFQVNGKQYSFPIQTNTGVMLTFQNELVLSNVMIIKRAHTTEDFALDIQYFYYCPPVKNDKWLDEECGRD